MRGPFSFCWPLLIEALLLRKIMNNVRAMKTFEIGMVGVDQGEVTLFSDFENDGTMWSGEGARDARVAVAFSQPFGEIPVVTVAMSMFDASSGSNIRFDIQAEGVTPQGFDIVFRTWGDSKVARARASWQAIGPVTTEEVWDI